MFFALELAGIRLLFPGLLEVQCFAGRVRMCQELHDAEPSLATAYSEWFVQCFENGSVCVRAITVQMSCAALFYRQY